MSRPRFRVNLHSSVMNFKELLAWNRCDIWILSDSNGFWNHNLLVYKRTLNHLAKLALAKWLSICLPLSGFGFESRCCCFIINLCFVVLTQIKFCGFVSKLIWALKLCMQDSKPFFSDRRHPGEQFIYSVSVRLICFYFHSFLWVMSWVFKLY